MLVKNLNDIAFTSKQNNHNEWKGDAYCQMK